MFQICNIPLVYAEDRIVTESQTLCYKINIILEVMLQCFTLFNLDVFIIFKKSASLGMCLPFDPRSVHSNVTGVDGFLRVIKIHSITSFGKEVKMGPDEQHVKEHFVHDKR
jgi:hypothetical protein